MSIDKIKYAARYSLTGGGYGYYVFGPGGYLYGAVESSGRAQWLAKSTDSGESEEFRTRREAGEWLAGGGNG